ncbi:unnamed protein product, partial [Rotaria sp. Silwood1]
MFMDMVSATDRAEWQIIEDKLYQVRFEFKLKTKSSNATNGDENNHIDSSDEDNDAFERFKNIRSLCDQFAWNVLNNNSHIFTFTAYKIWDKLVCSLSDIDLNSTYEHQLSTWIIVYGLFANLPHVALLSYSNAEFGTRLLFDLYHKYPETETKETEFLPKPQQITPSSDVNSSDVRSTLQKYLDQIYQWDRDFLFSSIVISTYT